MRSLVAFAFLISVAHVGAQEKPAALDAMVSDYVAQKQFIGSVLVAQNGEVLLKKGYGPANLEWSIPNTPTTKFRIGSMTKQFTAVCILLLEQQGKLKVTDVVKTYLPDAPASWDRVTLFHLLTHTSGIPNFTAEPEYDKTIRRLPHTSKELVALFREKLLEFVPGEKGAYSNSGYILLGYIIEEITGQDYGEFVRKNIFEPLAMNDSGYDSNTEIIERRASGYMPGPHGFLNAGYIDMSVPLSAGGLYSTTEDLLRWELGLFGGKLLKPESFKKMTTPFLHDYAFGIIVGTMNNHRFFAHGGAIDGFSSSMIYFPDDQLTVIVLSNLSGIGADQLSRKLVAIGLGEKPELPSKKKSVALPTAVAAQYVGRYAVSPQLSVNIVSEGEKLFAEPTGLPRAELLAQSESAFAFAAVDGELRFYRDEHGKVTHFILTISGQETKGIRQ